MKKMKIKVPKLIKSVRYSLFAVNIVFLITGIMLLITGVVALGAYNQYDLLLSTRFFTLPGFAIATGVIIFFAAVIGFYGAMSEHFYAVAGYVALLVVVLIFDIVITVMGFKLRDNGVSEIRSPMATSLQQYGSRTEIQVIWDNLQMGFECCGVVGRNDWVSNQIPVSCCHIDYGTISPFECTTANTYEVGCATALGEWLAVKASAVGIVGSIVTSVQVILIALAAWLAYRSKFEEIELES